jgi:hypothetical protein
MAGHSKIVKMRLPVGKIQTGSVEHYEQDANEYLFHILPISTTSFSETHQSLQ